jgi:hypothetical protein
LLIGIRRSQWLTWGRRPVALLTLDSYVGTQDYGDKNFAGLGWAGLGGGGPEATVWRAGLWATPLRRILMFRHVFLTAFSIAFSTILAGFQRSP